MRHRIFGNQLGRRTNVVKALYRSLLSEVLEHGRVETTLAKAKAVQGDLDKIINLGKKGTVNARRQVIKELGGDNFLKKVFTDLVPQYSDRNSGYSRIIRLGQRFSDAAEMVVLELVEGKKQSDH